MSSSFEVNAVSSGEALERLRRGNELFAAELTRQSHRGWKGARGDQRPFAIVLGCSDSRAPAETIFTADAGDLFVVRVAGNIVAPSLVGSIEFAAEKYGPRLCVVMGHTKCGAVTTAVDALLGNGKGGMSENVRDIVYRIRPSIEQAVVAHGEDREAALEAAIRQNIRASVLQIRQQSPPVEELVARGEMLVVGALYNLDDGRVDFFHGLDAPGTPGDGAP